jgi:hypothetical protein
MVDMVLAVVLVMHHHCLLGVMIGVQAMRMREMGMMGGLFVLAGHVMFGGLCVMLGGVSMVLGCFLVVSMWHDNPPVWPL